MLIAQVTKMKLERNDFEVAGMVRSVADFWKLMDTSIDVVLMDVKLKRNENGIDLAKDIKSKFPDLPIIFTTGNTRKYVEEEVNGLQKVKVLNKPLDFSELIDAIHQLVPGK